MKNKKIQRWTIALLSILMFVFVPEQVSAQEVEEDFSMTIFHTNDIHANIDNFGKMAYFLDQERNNTENSLYLDAGDIFSGNPVVDLQDGIPMIELLNEMNLDLMTIGNHEFDYGQDIFEDRRNESNFNWLATNMSVTDPAIPITDPIAVEEFNFGDVSVGVLGVTEAPPATAPSGIVGLEFSAYNETVEQYRHLRDDYDILIALNHIGASADRRMAEAVDFFDVIIGGHSHTEIPTPEVVNGTPIAQSGSNANNVGVLDLTLDSETGDVAVDGHLQPVAELEDGLVDETVQSMVDRYNAETDELLSEVIGHTDTGLNRDARWEMDVGLGNMITDALRNFAGTDIALTNNGGIRASIEPGDITARDVFTVDPFGNVVTIIEMTGHELKDIIEYSYHRDLENYGPQIDLQTSGLEYTIYTDDEGLYADSDLFIDGELMDLDQTYSITTNNFIVDGGDGYDFSEATIIQEDQGQVTQAIIQYVQELGTVNYEETAGRILTEPYEEEMTDAESYTPAFVDQIDIDLNEGEGVLPEAQSIVTNYAELPEGTVVEYSNSDAIDLTGDTTEEQILEVTVTYPDESSEAAEIPVLVIAEVIEDNGGEGDNGEDDNGEEIDDEVEDGEVGDGEESSGDETNGKVTDEDLDDEVGKEISDDTKVEAESEEVKEESLPQTGASDNSQLIGISVLLIGSTLFIVVNRNKKQEKVK